MESKAINRQLIELITEMGLKPLQRQYEPGEYLYRQGFTPEGLMMITKGLAKTLILAANGENVMVCLVGPDHILGDLEYFTQAEAVCSVLAIEQVEALLVPFRILDRASKQHHHLDRLMGSSLASRLEDNARRLEYHHCYPLEYSILIAALSRLGSKQRVLHKTELQEYLGVTPRHINRILARLKEEGLLDIEKGEVWIHDELSVRKRLAHLEAI